MFIQLLLFTVNLEALWIMFVCFNYFFSLLILKHFEKCLFSRVWLKIQIPRCWFWRFFTLLSPASGFTWFPLRHILLQLDLVHKSVSRLIISCFAGVLFCLILFGHYCLKVRSSALLSYFQIFSQPLAIFRPQGDQTWTFINASPSYQLKDLCNFWSLYSWISLNRHQKLHNIWLKLDKYS